MPPKGGAGAEKKNSVHWENEGKGKIYLVPKKGSAKKGEPEWVLTKPTFSTRVTYRPGDGLLRFADLTVDKVIEFCAGFEAHQKGKYGEEVFFKGGANKTLKMIARAASGETIVYYNDHGYFGSSKGKLVKYLEQLDEGEAPDFSTYKAYCKNKGQQLCTALVIMHGEIDVSLAVLAPTPATYEQCRSKYEVSRDKEPTKASRKRKKSALEEAEEQAASDEGESEDEAAQAASDGSEDESEDESESKSVSNAGTEASADARPLAPMTDLEKELEPLPDGSQKEQFMEALRSLKNDQGKKEADLLVQIRAAIEEAREAEEAREQKLEKKLQHTTRTAREQSRRKHGPALVEDQTNDRGELFCAICKGTEHKDVPFTFEVMECDHKKARGLWPTEVRGGKVRFKPGVDDQPNLHLLCPWCNKIKTNNDQKLIRERSRKQLEATASACEDHEDDE